MNIDWDDIESCDYCEIQHDCSELQHFIDSDGFEAKSCEECIKQKGLSDKSSFWLNCINLITLTRRVK